VPAGLKSGHALLAVAILKLAFLGEYAPFLLDQPLGHAPGRLVEPSWVKSFGDHHAPFLLGYRVQALSPWVQRVVHNSGTTQPGFLPGAHAYDHRASSLTEQSSESSKRWCGATFYLGLMSSLSGGAVPGLQAAFQQCWINAYDCRDLNTIEPPSSQGLSA
jgi:hypothetical protein